MFHKNRTTVLFNLGSGFLAWLLQRSSKELWGPSNPWQPQPNEVKALELKYSVSSRILCQTSSVIQKLRDNLFIEEVL